LRDFLTAYQLVTHQSYYRPFNRRQLVFAAIDGMLNATGDPHTLFLSPPQNKSANQQLNGTSFSGIGAIVAPTGQAVQILAPVPNSPASRAGIKAGDLVIKINGEPVSHYSGNEAVAHILGAPGTDVHLLIRRGKRAPFTVTVRRANIAPITAYGRMLSHHIGDLQIRSFGETTGAEVDQALHMLKAQGATSLILDLRGNPGGFVDAAQHVVSDFVSHGTVAYEKRTDRSLIPLPVIAGRRIINVPIAVLVDDQTASAAEITAAALRDDAHAILIGTRTYGKGSMQSVYSLADGSTVRITDRLWLTPRKQSIGNVGLQPDIVKKPPSMTMLSDPDLAAAEQYLLHHVAS
ncbi:MAG: S41 family peptidase, partial [Chloroflexota bacterium]